MSSNTRHHPPPPDRDNNNNNNDDDDGIVGVTNNSSSGMSSNVNTTASSHNISVIPPFRSSSSNTTTITTTASSSSSKAPESFSSASISSSSSFSSSRLVSGDLPIVTDRVDAVTRHDVLRTMREKKWDQNMMISSSLPPPPPPPSSSRTTTTNRHHHLLHHFEEQNDNDNDHNDVAIATTIPHSNAPASFSFGDNNYNENRESDVVVVPANQAVLRFGETIESLFLIPGGGGGGGSGGSSTLLRPTHNNGNNNTKYNNNNNNSVLIQQQREYVELAHRIAGPEADLSNSPKAWYTILQMALASVEQRLQTAQHAPTMAIQSSTLGADLLRLYRRASNRFSLKVNSTSPREISSQSSSTVPAPTITGFEKVGKESYNDHILRIHLDYAKTQAKYGTESDAKRTLSHCVNLRPQSALVYITWAQLECVVWHQPEKARIMLQQALTSGAEPRTDLETALSDIERQSTKLLTTVAAVTNILPDQSPQTPKRRGRGNTEQNVDMESTKRLKLDTGMFIRSEDDQKWESRNKEKVTSVSFSDVRPFKVHKDITQSSTSNDASKENNGANATDNMPDDLTTPQRRRATRNRARAWLAASSAIPLLVQAPATTRRPPLMTLLTNQALGRTQLGKPRRSADTPNVLEDEINGENDAYTTSASTTAPTPSEPTPKQKPKIPKMDLTYMKEWDPAAPRRKSSNQTTDSKATGGVTNEFSPRRKSSNQTNDSKASAGCTNEFSELVRTSVSSGEYSAAVPPSGGGIKCDPMTSPKEAKVVTHTEKPNAPAQQQSPQRERNDVKNEKSQLNHDFLSLVRENNMLRVNGVPYMQLAVMGKGGSSKVYRALSTDRNVVAIKKVKIHDMDEKAISSYANEIALLERLRGNPSIIQMIDSEVARDRDAIFVVMELGEIDLNQVLHKQAKEGNRWNLNMNFVRLIWQQMLQAVHSIHEERIVHGDLKPANFLFVKGSLKLIDFGIAKAIQGEDTTNIYRESQIGTLNYMSPEAIQDTGTGDDPRMRISRSSDLWSLGCILYQMVYGKTPFADLHLIQKMAAIVNPSYSIRFPEGVDSDAVDVIKQCLQRNPNDRPLIAGPSGLLAHPFLNGKNSAEHI